jgi:DsbC/DsbD-like thiol-disulfide interchange protein
MIFRQPTRFLELLTLGFLLFVGLVAVARAAPLGHEAKFKGADIALIMAEIEGQAYAAIDIQLAPGWHTYWHYPGASGIAPEMRARESRHIMGASGGVIYPAPSFFDDGVGGFIGYAGETGFVVPMNVTPGEVLDIDVRLGLCRDICVPVRARLVRRVSAAELRAPDAVARITQLLARRPAPPSAQLQATELRYHNGVLRLTLRGQALHRPEVVLVPGPGEVISPPKARRLGPDHYVFEFPARSALDPPFFKSKLRLLARHRDSAIEQMLDVRHIHASQTNNRHGD